jgi:predicted transcriptional regulator
MSKVVVRTGEVADFFVRARQAARHADQGQAFNDTLTLTFEDPKALFTVLSDTRRQLMQQVMSQPKTITELSKCLHRNRSSVTKDCGLLEKMGLMVSRRASNPGHGVQKYVQATASRIEIMTVLA